MRYNHVLALCACAARAPDCADTIRLRELLALPPTIWMCASHQAPACLDGPAWPLGYPRALRRERLDHHRAYAERYYAGEFVPGRGLERVLELLSAHGMGGSWLDLGAGPTTLLWSLAFPGVTSIAANDVDPEALVVLAQRTAAGIVSPCYQEAARRLGRSADAVLQAGALLCELLAFDVFDPWPEALSDRRFDLITAMGTFGLADGPEGFSAPFGHVRSHLRAGAIALGANWIRSEAFAARTGRGNAWLDNGVVQHAAASAGLRLVFVERLAIDGDEDYDAVIVWGMRPR